MRNMPVPKTQNPHEKTWDRHGSYQWTYFPEEEKQVISFFLSKKLHGKNIDLGGGWYLTYPNSTVVDLSQVCLDYNPAKEKVHFDLEELTRGKKLPFPDRSFDSATFISAWQYLRNPQTVVEELRRILKPGAEIYIINGQGAGLSECVQGSTTSDQIQQFFTNLGYDTIIENIPCFQYAGSIRSVCVAMPEQTLFEELSQIRNKTRRTQINQEITKNKNLFLDDFVTQEIREISKKLAQLQEYPVTKASQDYQAKVEQESQEYFKRTGKKPYIFLDPGKEIPLALTQTGEELFGTLAVFGEMPKETEEQNKLKFIRSINYFRFKTEHALLEECADIQKQSQSWSHQRDNTEFHVEFLASIPLNSFTRELQEKMYQTLKPNVPDLDQKIARMQIEAYYHLVRPHKQKRRINELIAQKQKILREAQIVEMRQIKTEPILKQLRKKISNDIKQKIFPSLDD